MWLTSEKALHDRLQLLKPRILVAESTYSYNGKRHNISSKLGETMKGLQQIDKCESIIVGPRDLLDSTWYVSEGVLISDEHFNSKLAYLLKPSLVVPRAESCDSSKYLSTRHLSSCSLPGQPDLPRALSIRTGTVWDWRSRQLSPRSPLAGIGDERYEGVSPP